MKLSEELDKYFNCLVWSKQPEEGVSKDMDYYISRVKELETQIEDMKCCENCEHCGEYEFIENNVCNLCISMSNWELNR